MAELNDTNINGTLTINNESIFLLIYPVGSIYISVNNVNPSTLFGGTWVAWGSGRLPIGVNADDSSFSTVEKTGGVKTINIAHTHTGPSHTHTSAAHTHTTAAHTLTTSEMPKISGSIQMHSATEATPIHGVAGVFSSGHTNSNKYKTGGTTTTGAVSIGQIVFNAGGGGSHAHGNTGSTTPGNTGSAGTGATGSALSSSQSILPPYITCYMWKRTA